MKYRITLLTFLMVLGMSPSSQAITVGEIVNPLEEFLECDTNDSFVQIICNDIQEVVNRELTQANLQLEDGGLLFTQTDNTNRVLDGGCTSKTELRSLTTQVKLRSSASLNLSGNAISEPAMFLVELPVQSSVNARLKTRTGFRDIKCRELYSDSYTASGSAFGKAKIGVILSLEPKYHYLPGYHMVQIKPIVDVSASVNARVTNVRIRGANPLFGFLNAIAGFASGVFQFSESILRGKGIDNTIESLSADVAADIAQGGAAFVLGAEEVGLGSKAISPFFLTLLANDFVKSTIREQNLEQVERDLEEGIKKALKLDENGERFFVFTKVLKPTTPLAFHKWNLKRFKNDYEWTRDCALELGEPVFIPIYRNPGRWVRLPIQVCSDYYWKKIVPKRPGNMLAPL